MLPTLAYVTVVAYSYVFFIHYKAKQGDRNDPEMIKYRLLRVSLATIINFTLAPYILINVLDIVPNREALYSIIGLTNIFSIREIVAVLKTLFLFMILFIGPLFEAAQEFSIEERYSSKIEIVRDLLFAPLTEEFFYTSLTTGSLLAYEITHTHNQVGAYTPTRFYKDPSVAKYLQLSPLFFGFAHLHHALEMRKKKYPLVQILMLCGFQFMYTTLFGFLTNYVFLNTGSLWCCFIAHSFCNFMGFPNTSIDGSLAKKIGYWLLLVGGVYGFGHWFDTLSFRFT